KQINKYLTPNLAAEQQKQIVESTVYQAQIISLNNTEFNNQDIECNNDFIENIYDTSQSYLSALISENEYLTIQEIWKITCLTSTKSIHHVILFKDEHYLCTCLLLINGVTEFEHTKEPFLTSSHHTKLVPIVHQLNTSTRMNLFQLDDRRENRVHKLDIKIHFNKTMSLAKQAIVLQEETQQREHRILKKHHNTEEVLAIQVNNEQLVSVENVLDPAYDVEKGAPSKKRIKGAQENNQTKKKSKSR
ncbi:10760_t:CDS:2, partial [Gigaspora margarita]